MRVKLNLNGFSSVHEILEFEPAQDGSAVMITHDGLLDLIVTGMTTVQIERISNELLMQGFADMSAFSARYLDEEEDDDDEDMDAYSTVCPTCGKEFNFEMTPESAANGLVVCPHCGEELEFDGPESDMYLVQDEDDEDELEYETTCPQCHTTIDVSKKDVDAGGIICPVCNAKLEFDAVDADNQILGDHDKEE
jgi:DNA-directed RNA polymerase subunit RPC12/RpoP